MFNWVTLDGFGNLGNFAGTPIAIPRDKKQLVEGLRLDKLFELQKLKSLKFMCSANLLDDHIIRPKKDRVLNTLSQVLKEGFDKKGISLGIVVGMKVF